MDGSRRALTPPTCRRPRPCWQRSHERWSRPQEITPMKPLIAFHLWQWNRIASARLRAAGGPATPIARRFGTIERAITLAEAIALTYLRPGTCRPCSLEARWPARRRQVQFAMPLSRGPGILVLLWQQNGTPVKSCHPLADTPARRRVGDDLRGDAGPGAGHAPATRPRDLSCPQAAVRSGRRPPGGTQG